MITYDSIVAMKMNRTLFDLNNKLNKVNKALETGSTINRPSDGPAVYNLVSRTQNYAHLYSALNESAQTGISIIDTDLQSFSTMQDKLDEIKTLLTTANSNGLSASQRADIQSRIDVLVAEIGEKRANTGFNGLNLFEMNGQYDGVPSDDYIYTSSYNQLTISDFTNVDTIPAAGSGGGEESEGFHQLTIDDFDMLDFTTIGSSSTSIQTGCYQGDYYYLVEDAQQLETLLTDTSIPDGNYILLNDIDLNGNYGFQGSVGSGMTLDGNGHRIENFYCYSIFSNNDGTIKNLGIENADVTTDDQAMFCNYNSGNIENCYVTASSISSCDGMQYITSGFCEVNAGSISNSYISDCNFQSYRPSCFVMDNSGTIENCYSAQNTIDNSFSFIGNYSTGSVTNCYQDYDSSDINTYQTSSWFASEDAVNTLNGMDGSAFGYVDGLGHPELRWRLEPEIEVGFSTDFRCGELNGETYYFIENADQFSEVIIGNNEDLNDYIADKKFMLLADIDLSDVEYPGSNYNYAYIDGNGHKLMNFNTIENASDQLIYENHGTIKNLGIEGFVINQQTFLCNTNYGTIDNVYIKNSTMQCDWWNDVGGIALVNQGTISNCYIADSTLQATSENGVAEPFCFSGEVTTNCFAYNVVTHDSSGSNTITRREDTATVDQPSWWFNTEAGAQTFGSAFEYVRGDEHITLKFENAGRSVAIPGERNLKDNSMRVQTGNTQNAFVTIDTTFYFDDNFNFDATSQANAAESLTRLDNVVNQIDAKKDELITSKQELTRWVNTNQTKIDSANNVISAWTGFDEDEMQATKQKLLSDIVNVQALQEQTRNMNIQMCQYLIMNAMNAASGSFSLNSSLNSSSWLMNLLSV